MAEDAQDSKGGSMNNNPRIELTDTSASAAIKLAEGNPGAISAISNLMKAELEYDKDSAWQGWGPLFSLDTHAIYGSRIWMLFKDVCGCDPVICLALLRSVQLGKTPESQLQRAIDREASLDLDAILDSVRAELPDFAAEYSRTPAA